MLNHSEISPAISTSNDLTRQRLIRLVFGVKSQRNLGNETYGRKIYQVVEGLWN